MMDMCHHPHKKYKGDSSRMPTNTYILLRTYHNYSNALGMMAHECGLLILYVSTYLQMHDTTFIVFVMLSTHILKHSNKQDLRQSRNQLTSESINLRSSIRN